nr:hypothetical protein [Escherichia marmotae]
MDWHTDSGRLWQTQGTTDAQGRATTTWGKYHARNGHHYR